MLQSLFKQFSCEISRDLESNEMCDFTDFVTFSNARNDTCFVKQTFCDLKCLERPKNLFKSSILPTFRLVCREFLAFRRILSRKKSV